jgi:methyl acetate hydrolase
MIRRLSRRDIIKATAGLTAAAASAARGVALARAGQGTASSAVDGLLSAATRAGEVPGVVAMAASRNGMLYEGAFGSRRLGDGPAMTRDTVFRIASMVKLITSVAALQLVEQGKLSLDAPVPGIDPALSAPQVLDGIDPKGAPRLRPAKRSITLRHLLTHTSGFTYRLWDAKAVRYGTALERLPRAQRSEAPHTPLMFDPGEHWQYGTGIDWVGRIVETVAEEPLDVYFRRHILDPLGMNDTAFVISPAQRAREASVHRRGPDGALTAQAVERPSNRHAFSGGGGIYSTAADYLTLLRVLMAGGAGDGVRILRPETVAMMGRNQIGAVDVGILRTTAPAVSNDVDLCPGVTRKWGLGHMLTMQAIPGGRSAGSMAWAGLFNTYYWLDPEKRVAAVFMTQVLPFADVPALHLLRQFERALYAGLKA